MSLFKKTTYHHVIEPVTRSVPQQAVSTLSPSAVKGGRSERSSYERECWENTRKLSGLATQSLPSPLKSITQSPRHSVGESLRRLL